MSPIISRAGFSFGFGRRRGGGVAGILLNITPSVSGKSIWNLNIDGKLTLNTGADYTITVDSPATVNFKIWGAGGGGGSSGGGGGGGSATGTMNLLNGTSYIMSIGSGGYKTTDYVATSPQGGGGGVGPGSYPAGTGGGYSGIFRTSKTQGNAVVIAGGGGGGGYNGAGGAGGYPSGSNGTGPSGGGGGTPTAGGAGGAGAGGTGNGGSALAGGPSVSGSLAAPGGGGGGGYYGGGGGGSSAGDTGGGGGGGSNYQNPTYLTSITQYSGSGTTAGNSPDPDRGSSGGGQPFPGSSGSPYAVPGSIVLS